MIARLGQHAGEGRYRLAEVAADQLGSFQPQQLLRRAVGKRDAAALIEAHDAGGDPRQHRLDKASALGELGVGADEFAALVLEVAASCD